MSGVEQKECQTAIVVEEDQVPEVGENTPEVTTELQENNADETEAVAATSAEALDDVSTTLGDIWPHTLGEECADDGLDNMEMAETPTTEDAVGDIEAEPHTVKVLSKEAEHEAFLPSCFQKGSVSTPSIVPQNTNDVKQSPQNDTAAPPTASMVDNCIAQDNASTSACADKLVAAEVSGASKETTEEGKVESASDSDTNSLDQDRKAESQSQEKTPSINSADGTRTFRVLAVPPQDLFFVAPPGCKPGQPVWIQGPHGPLQVQAPSDVKPGKHVIVRLAAPFQHEVVVPAGAKAGDTVTFKGENGEQLQAIVPPGKEPGQAFRVAPPVTMLRVPEGAIPGDQLLFKVPVAPQAPSAPKAFKELTTTVPPNMAPGCYFAAMINEASTPEAQEETDDLVWI